MDYWPVGVTVPRTARVSFTPVGLGPLAVSRVEEPIVRLAVAPRPARAVAAPVVALPVAEVNASLQGLQPVSLTAPAIETRPAQFPVAAPELDILSMLSEPEADAVTAPETPMVMVQVASAGQSDGFFPGAFTEAFKKTTTSLIKTGSSIVGAFRAFGGMVKKVVPF